MFRQPRKTKSIKINNQIIMSMCSSMIDGGIWFLKMELGARCKNKVSHLRMNHSSPQTRTLWLQSLE
jgi:hypothetical protein